MRKNGKNKKLALLVGMAMAFSAAYSVAPSDAFAADYTISATGDSSTTWTLNGEGSTADAVKEVLKTADNNITLDSKTLTALKGADSSTTEIAAGNTITVETKSTEGTVTSSVSYVAAAGSEGSKTGIDSSGKLAGSYSTITINGATGESDTATEASLASGATVGTYEVTGGKVKLSGSATTVNVANGAILSSDDSGLTASEINLAEGATLADSSSFTTEKVTVAGDSVDLSKATLKANTNKTLTITNNSGSVKLGAVAEGTTVNANGVEAGAVSAGATINAGTGDVTLTSVTFSKSGDDAKQTLITGNNITVTTAVADGVGEIKATGTLKLTGGFTTNDSASISNLKISADTIDLDKSAYDAGKITNITANNLVTSGKVTVGAKDTLPFTGSVTAGEFENSSSSLKLDSLNVTKFTNSASDEGSSVDIKSLTVNGEYKNSGTVNVDSLKLGSSAKFEATTGSDQSGTPQKINAKEIIVDSKVTADNLKGLSVNNGEGNVKLVIGTDDGTFDAEGDDKSLAEALAKAIYGESSTENINKLLANSTVVKQQDVSTAQTALETAQKAMKSEYNTYSAADIETKIAKADPFTTKLPSLADLQAMTSSDDQQNFAKLTAAQKDYYDAQVLAGTITSTQRDQLVAAMPKTTAEQAEKIRAAVQNAGKTAAAPAVTSMRTANVVADVATTNVVNRTAELRSFVPSAESEEKPDNLWFQYKHSKIDVDNGDTYSKSTVKTNSYQLGYDAKVSETDIVGGYVGTTTGSSEFNGPARSGSVDIKNALDLGIYGTHMMTKGQYIDYMLHRNKFDNRTMGQTYGTTDLGAMLRYGVKIAQPNGLTLDPYIQLAYDKISVDSYQAGENTISSDDSNNFSTKIGLNLITTGGLYGGVAYSRGLSGSYSAYVNGIAMPTQDNDTNVIYLNLGYRAGIARDIFLDLSLEKTFCDYDGWNAAGKINFYF